MIFFEGIDCRRLIEEEKSEGCREKIKSKVSLYDWYTYCMNWKEIFQTRDKRKRHQKIFIMNL